MPRQDTVDFLTSFAIGTVLGIGATLLLQPERSAKRRVVRRVKPYGKEMKRSFAQVRAGARRGGVATEEITSEAIDAGRELLDEFRNEVQEILREAREELRDASRERQGGRSKSSARRSRPKPAE